jgi:hopene-associated glycosyltransferase HpnB
VIEATLRSLLAQDYRGRFRIILVDDGSTDGTGAIASALVSAPASALVSAPASALVSARASALVSARASALVSARASALAAAAAPPEQRPLTVLTGAPHEQRPLTVLTGAPRPAGWSGKLWAVAQGVAAGVAEAGDTEQILLTDADIVHQPGHLAALVAHQQQSGCDLVSEMVALRCVSLAERALVPAFVFFFQLLYPFSRVNDSRRATAAAAGGTILLRRDALARIGGIQAVRGKLIDDVALAAAVKQGGSIWLGHSTMARSVRPYPGFADIWRMVARTAYVQLRFSPLLLLGTVVGMALVWLLPPAAALFAHGAPRWLGLAAWAMLAASYLPTLARYQCSALWAPFLPLVAAFYMAATLGSAVNHYRGRGVAWKGRAYQPGQEQTLGQAQPGQERTG